MAPEELFPGRETQANGRPTGNYIEADRIFDRSASFSLGAILGHGVRRDRGGFVDPPTPTPPGIFQGNCLFSASYGTVSELTSNVFNGLKPKIVQAKKLAEFAELAALADMRASADSETRIAERKK